MRVVVNGSDTHVATGGKKFDPALPAIVFLHGAGMDHSVWALLARSFAHHGFGVLAPDLPGHGRSLAHRFRRSRRSPIGRRLSSTRPASLRRGSSVTPWDR